MEYLALGLIIILFIRLENQARRIDYLEKKLTKLEGETTPAPVEDISKLEATTPIEASSSVHEMPDSSKQVPSDQPWGHNKSLEQSKSKKAAIPKASQPPKVYPSQQHSTAPNQEFANEEEMNQLVSQTTQRRVEANPHQAGASNKAHTTRRPQNIEDNTTSEQWVWIQENWTGFLGVAAVVLGITFAGVYVGFFASAFLRFLMIAALGGVFISGSIWMRRYPNWQELSASLQAGGGAIVLLAFLGGGYFEGLRFYESTNMGLLMMGVGLTLNIALAYYRPKQTLSASHVVFSLLALCAAPPILPILWISAIVCLFGVLQSHRHHWNLNLNACLVAYTVVTTLWSSANEASLYLHGIIASFMVFIPSLFVHYRKVYQSGIVTNCGLSHLLVWGLFGYNMLLFQQDITWVAIPMAAAAVTALGMAYWAKRHHSEWLFNIDFIVGELLLAFAIFSLYRFEVNEYVITWFVMAELLMFLILSLHQQWKHVSSLNIGLVTLAFIVFLTRILGEGVPTNQLIGLPLSLVFISYVGHHLVARKEPNPLEPTLQYGYMILSLVNFFLGVVLMFAFQEKPLPFLGYWGMAIALCLMMLNPVMMANQIHKRFLRAFLVAMMIVSWFITFTLLEPKLNAIMTLWHFSYTLFLPVALVLVAALGINAFVMDKKDGVVDYVLYGLGIHTLIILCWFVHPINAFLPTLMTIAAAAILLQWRGMLLSVDTPKATLMRIAVNNMGFWAMICLLSFFILDISHSQATVFNYFSIRTLIGILVIALGFIWMQQKPLTTEFNRVRLSSTIGFDVAVVLLILLLVLEFTAPMHGIGYSLIAIGLLILPKLSQAMPARKYLYSLGLHVATLIHVPIVSSQWASPLSNWYEMSHLTGVIALALSCVTATLLSKTPLDQVDMQSRALNKANQWLNTDKPLLTYVPIFLSLAVFLYWRFDGAILTAVWVAEVFAMVLLGIALRHQRLVNVAYGFLILCLLRLVIYDFANADLLMRALVFTVVGLLMIAIHVIYKKLKGRLE